ncbi:trypsin, alkaline A-like [Bicyclus anynana]|uniref:Trypsin, alkaline A-like n=1 Tax=Bicyclus anynana TaxID=110368 RepID=A0ABM3M1X1_BICAN|nr:trypsin, alkaline A-like [Bicyclus anynana]
MVTRLICLALALFCTVSAAPESRIVGGSPAAIQEFPSAIAVVYHYPNIDRYIQRCAGALVSSWHILTTAFCFTCQVDAHELYNDQILMFFIPVAFKNRGANINNVRLSGGSAQSLGGAQVSTAREIIQHPEYVAETRLNDLAVVVSTNPFVITGALNIVFIPPANTFLPDGLVTRVAGWGFESEGGAQLDSLQAITLTTISTAACQEAFADVNDIDINDSVLCASSPTAGTCFGDAGAPMYYNNVVVGLASYYKDCGNPTYPDVFTRVDRHTDWIMSVAVTPTGETPLRAAVY